MTSHLPGPEPDLVRLIDLSVIRDGRPLVSHASLTARPGEVVIIIGPNGAGKSTLIRVLAGLVDSTGEVIIDNCRTTDLSARRLAQRVALVPQDTTIDFDFEVGDVVAMGRHPHLRRFGGERSADRRIVAEAMRRVGIDRYADRPVTTLSGGERQLTLLAKAIAQQPRLLLLDEPTAALDLHHQLEVMSLVTRLARDGVGVIAVLHDLDLAARFADRLVLMCGGEILADGPPADVATPDLLAAAFQVRTSVRIDPDLGTPTVTVLDTLPIDNRHLDNNTLERTL